MAEEKTLLLTQEAYDKMKEELAWREGEYRDEILSKVSAARAEGDLSENGGYQAAREAQRVNQGRIEELTVKLRNAKILTAPKAGEVGDGSLVTLDVNGREMVYVLGTRDLSIATDYSIISPESPIGAASTALTRETRCRIRLRTDVRFRDHQGSQAARLSDVRHKLNLIFQRYEYKADSSNTTDEPAFSYISSNCNQI
mgnify:CR=1 FL=1